MEYEQDKDLEGEQRQNQDGEEERDEGDEGPEVGNFYGIQKPKRTRLLNKNMKLDKEMQKLKIKQLERKLRDEEAINMRTFNFKKGAYVEYGNTIQLLHVQSQCFIQGSKTCADEDNSCNKIELAVHGGKHVQFVAQGGFKYKQEGDKIHYNDQILLYHPKTKLYLHVTERLLKIED